jgi:putative ABC transport system permease protein
MVTTLVRRPLRIVLQILATAVGTGALALSLGVSSRLDGFLADLDAGGRRVAIANASRSETSTAGGQSGIQWQNPPAFGPGEPEALKAATPAIHEVAIVNNIPWDRIESGGASYRVRRVMAVDSRYASVMGLPLVAGTFISESEVASKEHRIAMSESAAKTLFGSASEALGKTLMADRGLRMFRGGPGAQAAAPGAARAANSAGAANRRAGFASATTQSAMESWTVVGVWKDPGDFERTLYGIPDMAIPWTAAFPSDFPGSMTVRTMVARADTTSLDRLGAALRLDVTQRYGTDAKVMVWEGDPSRPQADALGRARNALADFSALAQSLGALILAIACFGIASGIAVEAADRAKETAIRRAVGLTVLRSALGFCADGTITAAIGGFAGLGLAALFYEKVGLALDPYLGALGLDLGGGGGALPWRAWLAPLAAVGASFLFSLLPALRASSLTIAESLKE